MFSWSLDRGVTLAVIATIALMMVIGGLAALDADSRTPMLSGAGVLLLAGTALVMNRGSGRLESAEREARLAAARLSVTFASCGDALIATDEQGAVTFINPVAQALTGWREQEARGLPLDQVFRIVNEFTRETVENPVSKVLREGKVVGLANHTVLIARDGTERPIDDSGAPIRDVDNEVQGVILVFRDVTSRKLSEQARERLIRVESEREAALAANRAKDDFLALLSHELRNPLAAMLGWVQVMRSGKLGESEKERAIGGIQRSVMQQKRLVSDLLDVSRIISGRLSIERGPLDIDELVSECVEAHRSHAEAAGLELVCARAGAPVIVAGDRERLEEIVANLLSNAIKFTEPGGRVTVTMERDAQRAVIAVADTGVGMSPEQLGHIFDRFWQAETGRARRREGLGLGLTIVKHLVEEHDGTIRAESAGLGRGARFSVELPLEVGSKPLAPDTDPRRAAGVELPEGVRVLLVDDDRDGRESMAILLGQHGIRVSTAESSARAMQAFESGSFDVVVTDIGMPREDGYALLRRLREADAARGRRTPVIAVTGYTSGEERNEAIAAGFDEHVGKPPDLAVLLLRIRAVVASRWAE